MKKKIFAAVILVIVFAGTAMAYPGYGNAGKFGREGGADPYNRMEMGYGYGQRMWQDASPEIRAKMDERAKLNIDMRSELQKEIPNKAKARDIHSKIQKLNGEIETAHFEEMLKNPSKFRAQTGEPKREFSQKERAAIEELRKLHFELRTEFQNEKLNNAKIRDIHAKIQKIKQELGNERLENMLKNPEFFRNNCGFGRGFRNNPAQQ